MRFPFRTGTSLCQSFSSFGGGVSIGTQFGIRTGTSIPSALAHQLLQGTGNLLASAEGLAAEAATVTAAAAVAVAETDGGASAPSQGGWQQGPQMALAHLLPISRHMQLLN